MNPLNILKKIIPVLLLLLVSCEEDAAPAPNLEISATEVLELFDNNDRIIGTGTLTLRNVEVPLSRWYIRKTSYDLFGETGFGLSIIGNEAKDYLSFFSKPIINESGTYSFEEITGNTALYIDLGTANGCTDIYSNDAGTVTFDITRENIAVTISYTADFITEEPNEEFCPQTFVSTDSHAIEIEVNFPLESRYFN